MNLRKYLLLAMLPLVLGACKGEKAEPERPLYPTEGAVNARFSVSENTTVVFAKGNLQYQASTDSWRFAPNQYEVVGQDNERVSATNNGWIDLFGWGTSGFEQLMPYATTDSNLRYGVGEQDIAGTGYDWGRQNAISNAGRQAGIWRTLTYKEWRYVVSLREGASVKRAEATLKNVDGQGANAYGFLLLPDRWTLPEGCTFQYGCAEGFATNVYTMGEWNRMEQAGAVFLPAGGCREGESVSLVGEYGCYWSASYYGIETAYELYFMSERYDLTPGARSQGHCVRLVKEVE